MRPWLSVRAMTLRAKCRTLDWVWKKASNTCFRYSCIMELLIPDEMSPISFRSSCLDSFFPERTKNMISGLNILLLLLSIIESSTDKVYVSSEGLTLQVWTKHLFKNSNHYRFAYILCLLPASACLPPEDTSGGFWGSGFWGWWRRHCQPEYRCTRTSPLVQTSGWDAWSQGSLQNKKIKDM